MRRQIQALTGPLREEMFLSVGHIVYGEGTPVEVCDEEWPFQVQFLFQEGIDYSDEPFMMLEDEETMPLNRDHWMDATFVLPFFTRYFEVRVVLYNQFPSRTEELEDGTERIIPGPWQTQVYDGRQGAFEIETYDGVTTVVAGENTFGLYYDGRHYQYIHMALHMGG